MARGRKHASPIHGWVIIDKPLGMTSTQAVGKIKRLFDCRKVGHAGTLDPLATGVLPIALGEATKTVPYVQSGRKHYEFTLAWGEETDTCDAEGKCIATSPVRPSSDAIVATLNAFVGKIMQAPPSFSAIKVGGERAYDIARRGEAVDLAAREVCVESFRLVQSSEESASFSVVCGKGTYIRSLARDIGRSLGSCAYVTALRRTRVDHFGLEVAFRLEQLDDESGRQSALRPVASVLGELNRIEVDDSQATDLRQGRKIATRDNGMASLESYAMNGAILVAIGRVESAYFKPTRVLNLEG